MKLKFTFLLMMLAGVLMASAQASVKVTGTVYDSEGEPLIGVSITPKGNPHGVITDFDGNYEISVVTGSTLVYSYVGYDPAERKVTAAGVIDVELSESSTVLDEMVVVGYGVQKKSSVTG
ncbi:MAG: carboxypeptidase-like regulatory domain-containing protein, partial [Muribaculaceae bacterium]|nr:carboxypeptidase-like regulatory domain-containing protein [Muribaculaceae bacterium]